jgi:RNA polymerase sigma-70 factor (ECF subfamily)
MVGGDAAEDLAQDAFLKAWQEIGRFADEAALGTWLYRIATNLCLDHLRMTTPHRRVGGRAGRLPALRGLRRKYP